MIAFTLGLFVLVTSLVPMAARSSLGKQKASTAAIRMLSSNSCIQLSIQDFIRYFIAFF